MITQRELDLLFDIAKLLKKHGPDSFESLAKSISSPELAQHLSNILTQIATTTRTIQKTEKKKGSKQETTIPRSLTAIKSADPEKYQLLIGFHNDLIVKTVLPSLRDIKGFAKDCGLPEIQAKSRQNAISPFISSLIKFSNEDLREKIQQLKKYIVSDRSLEGWSNIILNRQQRSGDKE